MSRAEFPELPEWIHAAHDRFEARSGSRNTYGAPTPTLAPLRAPSKGTAIGLARRQWRVMRAHVGRCEACAGALDTHNAPEGLCSRGGRLWRLWRNAQDDAAGGAL
jgi:hypothetical protein